MLGCPAGLPMSFAAHDALPVENAAQLPINPRSRGGLCSTRKMIEVVYSPSIDAPWVIRSKISRIGAKTPIAA